MTRVVVSGLGVATPLGCDAEAFWNGLLTGTDIFVEARATPGTGILVGAISPETRFSEVPPNAAPLIDRMTELVLVAASRALADAGFVLPFAEPERVAVVLGTGAGGLTSVENQYDRVWRNGRRAHPFTVVQAMNSAPASWVSIVNGIKGPAFVTTSACASAAHAIGTAMALVRSGIVDVVVTGGTEAPLNFGTLSAWDAMRVLSRTKCRPFSLGRPGIMLSEGAGVLILESERHARDRGASWDIEIAGFGASSDAGDIVSPSSDGMARAMRAALRDAGMEPSELAYVNAHGTGTVANDKVETAAMKGVFGGFVPPVSSTKAVTGHLLGASGAIEAVATVMAMRKSIAPPTKNFEVADPECDIDCISNVARPMPIAAAMSNSFAFGGLNAALVFAKTAV